MQIEGNLFRRHQEQSSLNISILSRLNGIQEILDKQIESNKISLELFEKNDARNSVFEIVLDAMCDNLLELNKEQIYAEELVEKVAQVAEPLISKYKEVYKATQAETKEVAKQLEDKVRDT